MVIVAVSVSPLLSVTVRVIICVFRESVVISNVAPVPICPSMSDVHTSELPLNTSAVSSPRPVKVIPVPSTFLLPSNGLVITATGELLIEEPGKDV